MAVVDALIGIAVLGLIISRQLRVQPLRTDRRTRLVLVLGVVGVVQVVSAAGGHPAPPLGWVLLVAGLAVGAGLGVLRARTMRVWSEGGRLVGQGTWVTAVYWVLGIGAHVGLDLVARLLVPAAEPMNSASVLLFVAVSLGVQSLVVGARARTFAAVPAVA